MCYNAIIKAKSVRIRDFKDHSKIYCLFAKGNPYYPEKMDFTLNLFAKDIGWVNLALSKRK